MEKTFRTILAPVDFSPYASEALQYAATLAKRFDAMLLVLHLIDKDFEIVAAHHGSGRRGLPSPLLGPFAATLDEATERTETVAIDLREQANAALQHFILTVYSSLGDLCCHPVIDVWMVLVARPGPGRRQ